MTTINANFLTADQTQLDAFRLAWDSANSSGLMNQDLPLIRQGLAANYVTFTRTSTRVVQTVRSSSDTTINTNIVGTVTLTGTGFPTSGLNMAGVGTTVTSIVFAGASGNLLTLNGSISMASASSSIGINSLRIGDIARGGEILLTGSNLGFTQTDITSTVGGVTTVTGSHMTLTGSLSSIVTKQRADVSGVTTEYQTTLTGALTLSGAGDLNSIIGNSTITTMPNLGTGSLISGVTINRITYTDATATNVASTTPLLSLSGISMDTLTLNRLVGAAQGDWQDPTFGAVAGAFPFIQVFSGTDMPRFSTLQRLDTGKFLLAEGFTNYFYGGPATTSNIRIARFNANGTVDTTYGTNGQVSFTKTASDTNLMQAATRQINPSTGNLLFLQASVVGSTTTFTTTRVNAASGTVTALTPTFTLPFDEIRAQINSDLREQDDGRTVLAMQVFNDMSHTSQTLYLVRQLSTGALDTTFNGTGKTTVNLNSLSAGLPDGISTRGYSDGSGLSGDVLVVLGDSGVTSGTPHFTLMRYTNAGQLDTSFGSFGSVNSPSPPGVPVPPAVGFDVKTLADGRILVVVTNQGTWLNGVPDGRPSVDLLRYTAAGALDSTFGTGGHLRVDVGTPGNTIAPTFHFDPDGKLLVASSGVSSTADPMTGMYYSDLSVARFNADGTPDTSFGGLDINGLHTGVVTTTVNVPGLNVGQWSASGPNFYGALASQPDGSVVIGAGTSTSPWGTVIRIAANGDIISQSQQVKEVSSSSVNYVVDPATGAIVMASINGSYDPNTNSISPGTVTTRLSRITPPPAIEDVLSQTVLAGSDTISLNVDKNVTLNGYAGNDILTTGSGNDTLDGGTGNDTLTGGAGANRFVFSTALGSSNIDTITDFDAAKDTLFLSGAPFSEIAFNLNGSLPVSAFALSTDIATSDTRIIYNANTGALSYDADGTGAIAAQQFAILGTTTHPTLTPANFLGLPTSYATIDSLPHVLPEGNTGATPFVFQVTRDDATVAGNIKWSVAGSGANAANAADFVVGAGQIALPSGTLSFDAGQTVALLTVSVQGDFALETDEGFTVTLSNGTNIHAAASLASASATILNEDTAWSAALADLDAIQQAMRANNVSYTPRTATTAVMTIGSSANPLGFVTMIGSGFLHPGSTNPNDPILGAGSKVTSTSFADAQGRNLLSMSMNLNIASTTAATLGFDRIQLGDIALNGVLVLTGSNLGLSNAQTSTTSTKTLSGSLTGINLTARNGTTGYQFALTGNLAPRGSFIQDFMGNHVSGDLSSLGSGSLITAVTLNRITYPDVATTTPSSITPLINLSGVNLDSLALNRLVNAAQGNWQDPTFGATAGAVNNGWVNVLTGTAMPDLSIMQRLDDGKYLLAQGFKNQTTKTLRIARYNADGSVDTTYGSSGQFTATAPRDSTHNVPGLTHHINPSTGNILFVKASTASVGATTTTFTTTRVNASGVLTELTPFTLPIDLRTEITDDLREQNDGRIVYAMTAFDSVSSPNQRLYLVRQLSTGALDTAFNNGTGKVTVDLGSSTTNQPDSVFTRGDGSGNVLVVLGHSGNYDIYGNRLTTPTTPSFTLMRYTGAGVLDTSFNTTGSISSPSLTGAPPITGFDTKVLADGRVLVVATTNGDGVNSPAVTLFRYTAAGALDTSFGSSGMLSVAVGSPGSYIAPTFHFEADGRLLVASASDATDPNTFMPCSNLWVARFNADGTPDNISFGTNGLVNTTVNAPGLQVGQWSSSAPYFQGALASQPDGSVVIDANTPGHGTIIRIATNGMASVAQGSGAFAGDYVVDPLTDTTGTPGAIVLASIDGVNGSYDPNTGLPYPGTVNTRLSRLAPPPSIGTVLNENVLKGDNTINLSGFTKDITPSAQNVALNGYGGNDLLTGGSGNDTLNGDGGTNPGNDTLDGGLGNDTLTGGGGANRFVFSTALNAATNVDTITDFTASLDKIFLAGAPFAGISFNADGSLPASAFALSTDVVTSNTRIIYDASTGALYYDADGTGATAAVQFATLGTTTHPTLTAANFTTTSFAISQSPVAHNEGNSGSTPFVYTVTRSGDLTTAMFVGWDVVGSGTNAANAADFVNGSSGSLPTGSVSFAAGASSATLTVNVQGDTTVEASESFNVALRLTTGAAISTAQGTILNDDGTDDTRATARWITGTGMAAAPSGVTALSAPVSDFVGTLDTQDYYHFKLDATKDLHLSMTGLSGDANVVLQDSSGSLTLPGATISSSTWGNNHDEAIDVSNLAAGDYYVRVYQNSGDTNYDLNLTATAPQRGTLSFDPASSAIATVEGNSGTTDAVFTVNRAGTTIGSATVDWALNSSMPSMNGADFSGAAFPSGMLTFADGATSATITIGIAGDTLVETDEYYSIALSNASNAVLDLSRATASGTIRNDDIAQAALPMVSIQATNANKLEGNSGATDFIFTVSRSGDLSNNSSVNWGVTGLTADALDFVGNALPTGTVSFAANEAEKFVTVQVQGDTTFEGNEAFAVSLLTPTGARLNPSGMVAGGIIRNDDTPSTFAIAALNADQAEGNSGSTAFTFTVSRTGDTSAAASVNWALANLTSSNSDFSGTTPGALTPINFLANETSQIITIQVAGDTTVEQDERFQVQLSNAVGGVIDPVDGITQGVIRNDDQQNVFGIAAVDAIKMEGNSGTTNFVFNLTSSSGSGTVNWQVGGFAPDLNGDDFIGGSMPSGTVDFTNGIITYDQAADGTTRANDTFTAGSSATPLTIQVAGDYMAENDKVFYVALNTPVSGQLSPNPMAMGIIVDDDSYAGLLLTQSVVSVSAVDSAKLEGNSGTTDFVFKVVRSGDLTQTAAVNWHVAGLSSGITNADFAGITLGAATTINFSADVGAGTGEGISFINVTVGVQGDTLQELNESFALVIESADPNVVISNTSGSARAVILNDDTPPEVSISALDADKLEGDSGATAFVFRVARTGNLSAASTVNWSVASSFGTASANDFVGPNSAVTWRPSGTVTFLANETSKDVTVQVQGDRAIESDEIFRVDLLPTSTNAVLATTGRTAFGQIRTDDLTSSTISRVSIEATDADKDEGTATGATTPYVFTLRRSGDLTSSNVAVKWAVTGTGANAAVAADFQGTLLPTGTTTFAAGSDTATVTINVLADNLVEADKAFAVNISSVTNGEIIAASSVAQGVIRNDDFMNNVRVERVDAQGNVINDLFVIEGTSATVNTPTVYRISRDAGTSTGTLGWSVNLSGQSASVADFVGGATALSGKVSFNSSTPIVSGRQSALVTVSVLADSIAESNETFAFQLNATPGVSFANGQQQLAMRIIDDDDDYGSSTTKFGSLTLGSGAIGNIMPSGDQDWFKVTLAANTSYEFAIGSPDFAPVLRLMNANGNQLVNNAQDGVGTGTDGTLDGMTILSYTTGTTGGDYFISAQAANGGIGAYGIQANVAGRDDYASSSATTGVLALTGARSMGRIETSGDADWFKTTLVSGTVYQFSAQATDGLSGGHLRLLDAAGNSLLDAAGNPVGNSIANNGSIFEYRATTAGTAYLAVDGGTSGTGLYAVAARALSSTDATAVPTIDIVATADSSQLEGNSGTTNFVFQVNRSGNTQFASTVGWSVAAPGTSGSANLADFAVGAGQTALPSGTVNFAIGATSATITVGVRGDTLAESDESFTVNLSTAPTSNPATTPVNAILGAASATGLIRNDDALPEVSIRALTASALEGTPPAGSAAGSAPTTPFVFEVTRSGDTTSASSVNWTRGSYDPNVTAADFSGASTGTVTFAAGSPASQFVTINVIQNNIEENDESFYVRLATTATSNAVLGNNQATSTIVNDDLSNHLAVQAVDAIKNEGNTGFTPFTFTVLRSGDLSRSGVAVNWAVTGTGTNAAVAADFQGALLPGGTITFAANEASRDITINVAGNYDMAADKNFAVTLSNVKNAVLDVTQAAGIIKNDDLPMVSISSVTASANEGNLDTLGNPTTSNRVFTLTRSSALGGDLSVNWGVALTPNIQPDAADFVGGTHLVSDVTPGTVTFTGTSLTQTVTVGVKGDNTAEADEIMLVNVMAGNNYVVSGTAGTASSVIVNDDGNTGDPGNYTGDNTRADAVSIGTLISATDRVIHNRVGAADTQDYFAFTISATSSLALTLNGMDAAANADLQLLDMSGNVIGGSYAGGNSADNINLPSLAAGDYFARIYQYSGDTNYTLTMKATSLTETANNGATASGARNIGTLSDTAQVFNDSVASNDSDYYRFTTTGESDFRLSLNGLTDNADVYLLNSDGQTVMESSTNIGTAAESISKNNLAAGSYYVWVSPMVAAVGDSTPYTLTLSAETTAEDERSGNTLAQASATVNTVTFNATTGVAPTITGSVGSTDRNDYYRFTTTGVRNFSLALTGMKADADVQLFTIDPPSHPNGIVVGESHHTGSANETFSVNNLAAATYYVRVYQQSGNTSYTLNMTAAPLALPADNDGTAALGATATNNALSNVLGTLTSTPVVRQDTLGFAAKPYTGEAVDNVIDSNDWYKFTLGGTGSRIEVSLSDLSASADVFVYKTGGATSDTLTGGTGADQLDGDLGNDTLTGGTGADRFIFSTALNATTNVDTITDYNATEGDVIELMGAPFAKITFDQNSSNGLSAGAFALSTDTLTSNTRIIYNSATGALSYDADGIGATAAVKFATLSTPPVGSLVFGNSVDNTQAFGQLVVPTSTTIPVANQNGTTSEFFTTDLNNLLAAGTYTVQVNSVDSIGTGYRLALRTLSGGDTGYGDGNIITPLPFAADSDKFTFNSTTGVASYGVTLVPLAGLTGFVGTSDSNDYYRLTIPGTGTSTPSRNFTLNLQHLNANADVQLLNWTDSNTNGVVDAGETTVIAGSYAAGSTSDSITVNNLAAGTYYARVYQVSGDTNYSLSMSATTAPLPTDTDGIVTNATAITLTNELWTSTAPQSIGFAAQAATGSTGDTDGIDANDYYKFTLATGSFVQVALSGLTANADVEVYSAGNLVTPVLPEQGQNHAIGASPETFTTSTSLGAGDYYVRVLSPNGASAGTNYSVSLRTFADDFVATTGTTGLIGTALTAPTTTAVKATGTINAIGDVDWFAVTLAAGKTYTIRQYNAPAAGTAVAQTLNDSYIRGIYDSNGVLLDNTSNDDCGALLPTVAYMDASDSQVVFKATADGTYYIAAGAYGSNIGSYTVSVAERTNLAPVVSNAPLNQTAMEGQAFSYRMPWNTFTDPEGQAMTYAATLGDGTALPTWLTFDAASQMFYGTPTANSADINIRVTATDPGIDGDPNAATDNLSTSLSFMLTTPSSNDDFRADFRTTGRIVVGDSERSSVRGNIETAYDQDWFRVSLTSGTKYVIDLRRTDGAGRLSDPYFRGVLYSFNPTTSATTLIAGTTNDDANGSPNSQVRYTASATGDYFVSAGGFGKQTGAYVMSVVAESSTNNAPIRTPGSAGIADQTAYEGQAWRFTIPSTIFTDADTGQNGQLTYSAELSNGSELPSWLKFDATTRTFTGTPAANSNDLSILLTARDGGGLAVSDIFALNTPVASQTNVAGSGRNNWTIMVYMAADNNLDSYALKDLNEMESVTLPSGVKVVFMLDRLGANNSYRGAVATDANLTTNASLALASNKLATEVNSGDPATLRDFIDWSASNYTADHYGLVVWDHGGGLSGTSWDTNTGVAGQVTNLSVADTTYAIQSSVLGTRGLDMVGFDTCLQGMVEQAYDLRNNAQYVVASQNLEPGDGWDYASWLQTIAANPDSTARQVAAAVVTTYGDFYHNQQTMAAVNTGLDPTSTPNTGLVNLRDAINTFVTSTSGATGGALTALQNARSGVTNYNNSNYLDLGAYMANVDSVANSGVLGAASDPATIAGKAKLVSDALTAAVVQTTNVAGINDSGLSIFLPGITPGAGYTASQFQFVNDSNWNSYITTIAA